MEFEGRRKADRTPNLTPLIDLVFLLLIYFMLTAHFVQDESLTIDLPDADSAVKHVKDEPVEILIMRDGTLRVSGKEVSPDELESHLSAKLHMMKDRNVTIRGDSGAEFGAAVSVFDAARKAGAESVDVMTERSK